MIRLHLVVEGQTEEQFAKSVLTPYLGSRNIVTDVRLVITSRRRNRTYRGGMSSYQRTKKDIIRWIKEDDNPDSYFSTMFDLFALPTDFPSYTVAQHLKDPRKKVLQLEEALKGDISHQRFMPYLQLHEFEALLLSEPSKFAVEFLNHKKPIENLSKVCSQFDSPELIDDGLDTAPSKRIIQEIPEYEGRKPSAGPRIAHAIGLEVIRQQCPHFRQWIDCLEGLSSG